MRIVYDKGVDSKANRAACAKFGIKEGITRKKPKGKAYNPWEKKRNKVRFVAERTFGTLKRTYGLSRAKLVGLEKVASKVWAKSIAYNLKRASNRLTPRLSCASYEAASLEHRKTPQNGATGGNSLQNTPISPEKSQKFRNPPIFSSSNQLMQESSIANRAQNC